MADLDPLAVKPPMAAEQLAVQPKIDYWTLQKVNDAINRSQHLDGKPILPSGKPLRDCEWFTNFKRQELIDRYQASKDDLVNVYVATEMQRHDLDEPDHVVLRMGDWILDNRVPNPYKYKAMLKKYREYPGWTTLKARK